MTAENRKFIGELLIKNGLISKNDLKNAIDEQKRNYRPVGSILVEKGIITEEQLLQALSEQMGYPYVDLDAEPINSSVSGVISNEIAQKYTVAAIDKKDSTIRVAMVDPLNLSTIDAIQEATGLTVYSVFATREKIKRRLAISKAGDSNLVNTSINSFSTMSQGSSDAESNVSRVRSDLSGDNPIIKTVNEIIEKAVEIRASDIHMDPEERELATKYRVDGVLIDGDKFSKNLEPAIISRIKIMAGMDIAEKRLPQDGRINVKTKGKDIDLRIATFPTIYGEKIALRVLDKSKGIYALEELGMSGRDLKIFEKVISRPHGVVFVCGPTGCGKSTTLYGVLSRLDRVSNNVMTLEDPVEYMIPRVKQSQINVKAGLTFAGGLRAILRQDPDIIMIGEVRDRETAEIAIHSALTGHLVFSTIHTNDAPSAVARLIDMDIEPFLIASSLSAVLSQRLVRMLCPKCKRKHSGIPQEALDRFNISRQDAGKICEPVGCKTCNTTGYKGRTGVFELLTMTDVMREEIIKKSSQHILKKIATDGGMRPMLQDGIDKVIQGITSLEEVIRVAETTT